MPLDALRAEIGRRRAALYARCRPLLSAPARAFWDAHPAAVAGYLGRFATEDIDHPHISFWIAVTLPLVWVLSTGGTIAGAELR